MPLAVGGASSLANLWFAARATEVGLFTGSPVAGTAGNELATQGYRRGSFGSNPFNYDEGSGTITNANSIALGTLGAASTRITHWAIMDAAGVILWRGAFQTAPGVLARNTAIEFRPGDISLRIPFA